VAAKKSKSQDLLSVENLRELADIMIALEAKSLKKWSKRPAVKRGEELQELIEEKFPGVGDEALTVAMWVDLYIYTRDTLTGEDYCFTLMEVDEAIPKLMKYALKNPEQFQGIGEWVSEFGCLLTEGRNSDIGAWFHDHFSEFLFEIDALVDGEYLYLEDRTKTKLEKLAKSNSVRDRVQAGLMTEAEHGLFEILAKDGAKAVRLAVAKNSSAPQDILKALSKDSEELVREAALSNESISLDILQSSTSTKGKVNLASSDKADFENLSTLADDKDEEVRRAVAENIKTPPEVLAKLAGDKSSDVREAVAGQMNASKDVLFLLAKDKDEFVRASVGYRVDLSEEIYTLLAKDKSSYVRAQIAENLNAPKKVLALLAKDKDSHIRELVLQNQNLDEKSAQSISNPFAVKLGLAQNPSTPVSILEQLCSNNDKEYEKGNILSLAIGVAQNPVIPSACISILLKNKDEDVIKNLAANPSLPQDSLNYLMEQSLKKGKAGKWRFDNRGLELGLASNPAVSPDYLTALLDHVDTWVISTVAENPNLPVALISKLAKKGEDNIVQGIASNPSAPWVLLQTLMKDEGHQLNIAGNTASHPEDLDKLASKKGLSDWILYAIAQNSSASQELILKLGKHKDSYIRSGVIFNSSTPSDLREKILATFMKSEIGSPEHLYIARCPYVSSTMLTELAEKYIDKYAPDRISTLSNIAENPNASKDLLSCLANERSVEIRAKVAKNRNTPVEILIQLSE